MRGGEGRGWGKEGERKIGEQNKKERAKRETGERGRGRGREREREREIEREVADRDRQTGRDRQRGRGPEIVKMIQNHQNTAAVTINFGWSLHNIIPKTVQVTRLNQEDKIMVNYYIA